MLESSELVFYKNVFGVAKCIINKGMPVLVETIVNKIDVALRDNLKQQEERKNENGLVQATNCKYRSIDTNSLDEIVEEFKDRPLLRDRYLRKFPSYKRNAEEIVSALNKEIEELNAVEYIEVARIKASAFLGGFSGIIRVASFFIPLSASVSILGNAMSGLNSAFQAITSYVENSKTEKHMSKCLKLTEQYNSDIQNLYRWFAYNDQLINSMKKALGSRTAEKMFKSVQALHEKVQDVRSKYPVDKVLKDLSVLLVEAGYPQHVAFPIAACIFQILWVNWGRVWISDWSEGALPFERMKTYLEIGAYSVDGYFAYRNLENISVACPSPGPLFATVTDLFPVLEYIGVGESKSSKRIKTIKENVKNIEQNMLTLEVVYKHLKAEKDAKERWDKIQEILQVFYEVGKLCLLIFCGYCISLLRNWII